MEVFWFWFFFILLLVAVAALPTWPYTRDRWVYRRPGAWPYAPSAAAALVALMVLILFWFGILAIAWPWYAAAPPPV